MIDWLSVGELMDALAKRLANTEKERADARREAEDLRRQLVEAARSRSQAWARVAASEARERLLREALGEGPSSGIVVKQDPTALRELILRARWLAETNDDNDVAFVDAVLAGGSR